VSVYHDVLYRDRVLDHDDHVYWYLEGWASQEDLRRHSCCICLLREGLLDDGLMALVRDLEPYDIWGAALLASLTFWPLLLVSLLHVQSVGSELFKKDFEE
jgi:hypothetical protein